MHAERYIVCEEGVFMVYTSDPISLHNTIL